MHIVKKKLTFLTTVFERFSRSLLFNLLLKVQVILFNLYVVTKINFFLDLVVNNYTYGVAVSDIQIPENNILSMLAIISGFKWFHSDSCNFVVRSS